MRIPMSYCTASTQISFHSGKERVMFEISPNQMAIKYNPAYSLHLVHALAKIVVPIASDLTQYHMVVINEPIKKQESITDVIRNMIGEGGAIEFVTPLLKDMKTDRSLILQDSVLVKMCETACDEALNTLKRSYLINFTSSQIDKGMWIAQPMRSLTWRGVLALSAMLDHVPWVERAAPDWIYEVAKFQPDSTTAAY